MVDEWVNQKKKKKKTGKEHDERKNERNLKLEQEQAWKNTATNPH